MAENEKYALGALFGRGKNEFVDYVPHCGRLGMEVVETGPRFATLKLPFQEELVGDPIRGVVFGGVITTLLDQTCGTALLCSLEEVQTIATLDLRIDYLRAAKPGLDLLGHAECYKLTKNVAFMRGYAYDESPEDPFASCIGSFMVGSRPLMHPLRIKIESGDPGATPDDERGK